MRSFAYACWSDDMTRVAIRIFKMLAEDGSTTIMVAAVLDNISIARLLLQYNVDVNVQELAKGMTPIMQAVYNKNLKMAKLLLEAGADINIQTSDGENAIDIAMRAKNDEMLKLLHNNIEHPSPTEKQCFANKTSVLRQKSLKVKEFFTNMFKRDSSSASPNDRNETFRRNCLLNAPQPFLDSHEGREEYLRNKYSDFGAVPKFVPQRRQNCASKKRHSLADIRPLPVSTIQQCPATRTDVVCDVPRSFVPEQTEYDDIPALLRKLELNRKAKDAKTSPRNACSMASATAIPSEYNFCTPETNEDQRYRSYQEEDCSILEEDSEFDSIESIKERIRIREKNLGIDPNQPEPDPFLGYVKIKGAAEALKRIFEQGSIVVHENIREFK